MHTKCRIRNSGHNKELSFTLLELLIVLGILAILAVIVLLVINPAEFLRHSRDTKRQVDLQTINSALAFSQAIDFGLPLGDASKVYVSLPDDASSTCGSLGLPALPAGWTYHCSGNADYQKTNGTGWIPVNLNSLSTGSPLANLPIDPVNASTSGLYYTYVTGGSWELTGQFESSKYVLTQSNDGGPDLFRYEIGSDLQLSPFLSGLVGYWKFDETGTTVLDSSGFGINGITYSSTTPVDLHVSSGCKSGSCISFDGVDERIELGLGSGLDIGNKSFTMAGWIKTGYTGNDQRIFAFGGPEFYLSMYLYFDGRLWGYVYSSHFCPGTCYSALKPAGPQIQDNNWHHVAYVIDRAAGGSVYIDGNRFVGPSGLVAAQPMIFSAYRFFSDQSLTFYNGRPFNGRMDEPRFYNRALSVSEVKTLYDLTK